MPAYSYHRILQSFGRSINDKTLECDLRLLQQFNQHAPEALAELLARESPEEKLEESANLNDNSSQHIYDSADEFDEDIITLQSESMISPNASKDSLGSIPDSLISNAKFSSDSDKPEPEPKKPDHRHTHVARTLGHEIHLSTKYRKSDVKVYRVEIAKPQNRPLRRRIKRGISPHGTYKMMGDVVRYGIISQAQLMNHLGKMVFGGGTFNETARKYFHALTKGDETSRPT
ncbi:uncharacterized protein N7483_000380 [Penicillium malachiteum]|uniref:uncharacterized protein n=1 Tax=Penicillium malachiteum TaxID=1324776 RepID=UPI002548DBFC|nr:uncharacterized protein N7483_000380 [Penicillium malachiteum]KAJ5735255.1 hypothetical protein N7483_000380 [Penicillium malachiteum]